MHRKHSSSAKIFLAAIALSAATFLVYRPAWHGGFLWDDDRYVTHNPLLTAPDGLGRIWFSLDAPSQYFPLTYTVLRFGQLLWALNPTGYHFLSISLHVCNALLVWRILVRLNIPGGWLAAAIFALHPIQVESVAWISELKNVLMGFCFLWALIAWIEYVDAARPRRRIFYLAALLFCSMALFAKATACTLPAALILILWLKGKPIGGRELLKVFPFVVLALGVGLLAIWWEKYHQGTRVLVALGPIERLLIASRAVWFYLSKIFWPSDLTFIYPRWQVDVTNPLAYLGLIAALAAAAVIYYGRRWFGRGVEVAFLFFLATLSPLLGFIMLYTFRYSFVADHYQYLACIGPIALASASFATFVGRMGKVRWMGWTGACGILVCLCLLTSRQSSTYRDIETLWRTTIEKDPRSWMAYNNLGVVQFDKGEIDDAIKKYKQSLELHPDYPEALYNLGSAVLQKGDVDKAIDLCGRALKLQPTDADAHVVLGNALMLKDDVDGAINHYRQAVRLRPNDPNAHHNLGVALQQQGKKEEAAREMEKAARPDQNR